MTNWTRRAAIVRMNGNQALRDAYQRHPLTKLLVRSALKVKLYDGYNRTAFYYAYKDWMWAAVGKESDPAFWTCVKVIDDLLPPDACDLDLEGVKSIYDHNPPLPGLPPRPPQPNYTAKDGSKFLRLSDLVDCAPLAEARRQQMRAVLERIQSGSRVIRKKPTMAPFQCEHCGFTWYGWTGSGEHFVPEGCTLCDECYNTLDTLLYKHPAYGSRDKEDAEILHAYARTWIADTTQKPFSRQGKARYRRVPRWVQQSLEKGWMQPNQKEHVYTITLFEDGPVRVEVSQDHSVLQPVKW